jgi:hypothetical protein
VEKDKIDEMEKDETEMMKKDVPFTLQCKFLYRKKIVKNNFHDIKAVSNFDFFLNGWKRQRYI